MPPLLSPLGLHRTLLSSFPDLGSRLGSLAGGGGCQRGSQLAIAVRKVAGVEQVGWAANGR